MDAQLHIQVSGLSGEDRDFIADRPVLLPGAVPEVHSGMRLVFLLRIEERLLVLGVGQAPRDVLVVADQHDGSAGEAHPRDVIARRVHRQLEPDRGQSEVEVGVAGEQCSAAHALRARDSPVVARATLRDEARRQSRQPLVERVRRLRRGVRDLAHRLNGCRRRLRVWTRVIRRLLVRRQDREPLRRQVGSKRLVEERHHQGRVGEVQRLRHIALDQERIDG